MTLAAMSAKLADFAAEVRSVPGVQSVTSAVSPRLYNTGPLVEAYVDSELSSGNAIAWSLEIREEDGSWCIESNVLYSTSKGQDPLLELPTRYAVEAQEIGVEVRQAAEALIASLPLERLQHL